MPCRTEDASILAVAAELQKQRLVDVLLNTPVTSLEDLDRVIALGRARAPPTVPSNHGSDQEFELVPSVPKATSSVAPPGPAAKARARRALAQFIDQADAFSTTEADLYKTTATPMPLRDPPLRRRGEEPASQSSTQVDNALPRRTRRPPSRHYAVTRCPEGAERRLGIWTCSWDRVREAMGLAAGLRDSGWHAQGFPTIREAEDHWVLDGWELPAPRRP